MDQSLPGIRVQGLPAYAVWRDLVSGTWDQGPGIGNMVGVADADIEFSKQGKNYNVKVANVADVAEVNAVYFMRTASSTMTSYL